ncbi:hypothetical protein DFR86_00630 [Acidianus sulfidivorans JP7]|uniref:Uncharacterized protein n=1 Tax=Acidianus sulfidivorans JP7 TaxID=619593 RepID=A0A2U9IJH1_9CREN|nr:hypothetical protein [Acidianus sulfidivorans]AWR96198.1 hypothetical protein DFR86_00630 [Acidianus sulfidivorans JP7]
MRKVLEIDPLLLQNTNQTNIKSVSHKEEAVVAITGMSINQKYLGMEFYIVACKPEEIEVGYGLSKESLARIGKLILELIVFLKIGIDADWNVTEVIEEERCIYSMTNNGI